LVEARCPVCGKVYNIPEGTSRMVVETKFLKHKDACRLPVLGDLVRVGGALAIVDGVDEGPGEFPLLTVHYPSGRESVLEVAMVGRVRDMDEARERFFG